MDPGVVSPAAAVLLVSVGLTAQAVGSERFAFWFSHTRSKALTGGFLTFIVLGVISAAGVVTGRAAVGDGATFFTDLAAAGITQSTLRKMKGKDPTTTLALGFLAEVLAWTETWVGTSLSKWVRGLDDNELVDAAARLDEVAKGPVNKKLIKARAQWRQDFATLLAAGASTRDAARRNLEDMVCVGYPTYRIRRPR